MLLFTKLVKSEPGTYTLKCTLVFKFLFYELLFFFNYGY